MRPRSLLGIVVAMVIASGCGTLPTKGTSTHKPGAAGVSNDSSSSTWLDVGRQIEVSRARSRADNPSQAVIPTFGPYLTAPIDINAEGTVTLKAGPISEGAPQVTVVSFPPDATSRFDVRVNPSAARLVVEDGERFVILPIEIMHLTATYSGLRVWLQ